MSEASTTPRATTASGDRGEARKNLLLPHVPRWPRDAELPVIRLEGVGKSFGDKAVLSGLDLDVITGQTTVVCGECGSGKSVLVKLMRGLKLPDEWRVLLFGEDTRKVGARRILELRKRMGMMFQNYALMDSFTVAENIALPIYENTKVRYEVILQRVRDLLRMLELEHAIDKMPSELSGGMKKRVSLARAVVHNPEVVLFDEPTTGLDPVMIEFVDDMIIKTRDLFGITSVAISHDMTSTTRLADRVAMLEEGRIVEYGTLDEVVASDRQIVKVFFDGIGEGRGLRTDGAKDGEVSGQGEEVAAELFGVHKYFGPHHILKGVDLAVPENKITVIIGGSGSGKSVIMKHIIGLFQPTEGRVEVFGQDLSRLNGKEMLKLRARFGMLFQGAALIDAMTVRQNVAFPLVERGLERAEVDARVQEILAQLQVEGIASAFPNQISNGQKKRVGLARAIVTQPQIMIYDEPTTGQDPIMIRYVDSMIAEAQEMFDITSLVVSHDMQSAFRIGHRIAMLHEGEIRAFGSPAEVAASSDPWVRRFIYAGTEEGELAARELGLG